MKSTRRHFLQVAGLSAVGIGAGALLRAVSAQGARPVPYRANPNALTAERWAMVVDLREGCPDDCKACVDACHTIHNVPQFPNPKDEIKWIWKDSYEHAFPGNKSRFLEEFEEERLKGSPIILLCNHCDNPPCVRVCPTKATFRRADGIVMMDYHRCIGCRFCMAGCPFGARNLNWRDPRPFIKEINPNFPTRTRGVVEKCNFCAERLALGLIPACVEACRKEARKLERRPILVFGDIEDANSEVREALRRNHAIRRKPHLGTMPQVYYIL
jgi:molybdopterin-containing oxidoreductase family iron-sulfur binding subunit